jgi:hypothetical protein
VVQAHNKPTKHHVRVADGHSKGHAHHVQAAEQITCITQLGIAESCRQVWSNAMPALVI